MPGRTVASVYENRSDGSAACPPLTSGFSGYNLVLRGCRHPRAVPLAFGDSAKFVDLAQYAVFSGANAVSQVDAGGKLNFALFLRKLRKQREMMVTTT